MCGVLFKSFLSVDAFFDHIHHFAEMYKLVADDLAVGIETEREYVAFGHLKVSYALALCGKDGAYLGAQAFSEVSSDAPIGSPFSEKAVWLRPYASCLKISRIATLIASHTRSVLSASRRVLP